VSIITQNALARPSHDLGDLREHHPYGKITGDKGALPAWARKWNGETRSVNEGATTAGTAGNGGGQSYNERLYCRKSKRRSLSDAMVAMGLLVIRKRVIPLPIKRVMKLKIS
jgi:hypothetical protein